MRRTYRFGCHSLIAPSFADHRHERSGQQLPTPAHVPQRTISAARSARAQRTVARATIMLALLCAASAFADEPWSRDARAFHTEGFGEGVTTQSLASDGLTPDPLAPDAGTVAYIVHTKGQAWAALVVYDPRTRRYRHVCGLVGPFESASDIQTFDPLLRSVLGTVHERGFPARVVDYTPAVRTMDLAQYEGAAPPPAVAHRPAMPQPVATIPAAPPARPPLTAQQALTLFAVGGAAIILTFLCLALVLFLFFRHREQMAVVRTATRPPQPSPRPTAVPAPPPVAKQQT